MLNRAGGSARRAIYIASFVAFTAACNGGGGRAASPLIATQTHEYELAGATHKQASCLAAVTSRIRPPAGDSKALVLVSPAQGRAIDRCVDDRTFERIGAYIRQHPPTS